MFTHCCVKLCSMRSFWSVGQQAAPLSLSFSLSLLTAGAHAVHTSAVGAQRIHTGPVKHLLWPAQSKPLCPPMKAPRWAQCLQPPAWIWRRRFVPRVAFTLRLSAALGGNAMSWMYFLRRLWRVEGSAARWNHVECGHVPWWERRRQKAALIGKLYLRFLCRKRSVDEGTKRDEMVEK